MGNRRKRTGGILRAGGVMMRRLLCAVGIHKWTYLPPLVLGMPMCRECCCGKRQCWNYSVTREHGVIVWDDDVQGVVNEPSKPL